MYIRQRTATITWIAYENYGTYLQAYALQHKLKELGYQNHILYDSYFAKYVSNSVSLKQRLKNIIKAIIRGKSDLTHLKYKYFAYRYLDIDYNIKSIEDLGDKYDTFICGSDQIWSPYLDFEPFYYLGFEAKKKIAYAPSLGTGECDELYMKNAIPQIRRFDFISVREKKSASLLSKYIDKEIITVVDPTLLLNSVEWDKLTCKIKEKEYIVCYFLTPNKWYMDYVKAYALKYNMKLLCFRNQPVYENLTNDLIDGGPIEFISYIKNANIVFTDSFHASIFSLIFHKNFFTFKRFKDGEEFDQNTRIYDLFASLNIRDRFLGEEDLDVLDNLKAVNWYEVDKKIKQMRHISIDYLEKALA